MPRTPRARSAAAVVLRRQDLGVDLQLAEAARDQLRVLRSEIEDGDGVAFHGCGW